VVGPNVISFAVRIIGCSATSNIVALSSRTGSTSPALTVESPTAVTMSTFRSADPAFNWPLIAGLGALAAVVIGGLAVTRKRAAGR